MEPAASNVTPLREGDTQYRSPPANIEAEQALLGAILVNNAAYHRVAEFLRAEHFRSNPDHYTRNAIYISDDESLSLYALVWLPGQWTPVHDHGSWGVVGVVQGVLEERSFMSADGEIRRDSGIHLKRGGVILLDHGSVTTFVPNPDHIHMTGVAPERARVVSLHLYGRTMSDFNIYDVAGRRRRRIAVAHNES